LVFANAAVLVAMLAAYVHRTGSENLYYRMTTTATASMVLMRLDMSQVSAFIDSYHLFDKTELGSKTDESSILDYYRVISHLCALGPVEKMYIPPVLDLPRGVVGNQNLFEEKFAGLLGVGPNHTVLDVGCGTGRIAHHVSTLTGAKVVGLNIDEKQVQSAREYAQETGLLGDRLDFVVGSYNDPLPFADESFDGLYNVQAWTYAIDLKSFFAELSRVLKPGAVVSTLDWFQLDAYNESNASHVQLLTRTKALIGGVRTPRPEEYHQAMEEAGFEVISSGEASATGHQYPLIKEAADFFGPLEYVIKAGVALRALPEHILTLIARLNLYKEDFLEADRLGLFTTSYHIVARKKLAGP